MQESVDHRRRFFEEKADRLFRDRDLYCVLLEGSRSKTGVGAALAQLFRDPAGAVNELKTQFTNNAMKTLLRSQIERDLARLEQCAQAFVRQLADFVHIDVLNQRGQFRFFRRLLNYDDWRIAGHPKDTQFLDYQVVNSDIEAERDHLRVGDHFVRILTMKEAIGETRPLVLDALLKVPANFLPSPNGRRSPRTKRARRSTSAGSTSTSRKRASFRSWATIRENEPARRTRGRIETGGHREPRRLPSCSGRRAAAWRFLTDHRAVRQGPAGSSISSWASSPASSPTLMAISSSRRTTSSTPISRSFPAIMAQSAEALSAEHVTTPTLVPVHDSAGEKTNAHLGAEYLAVLETDNGTPYYLNLHNGEVAHTLILGMTGSGKSYLCNFLLQNAQKY